MRRARTLILWLIGVAAALYALVVGAFWLGQERLLYPGWSVGLPPLSAYETPGAVPVEVPVSGGIVLRGLYRAADPDAPTLVVFHGNGGHDARKLWAFGAHGWGTLMVPYRGFSGNPGRPSQAALVADARAVLDFATGPLGLSPDDVVVYGESLGSGVAVRAAAGGPWRAVVLEAPYAAVVDRAAQLFPWVPVRLLLRDRWRSVDHVAALGVPLLVLHGTDDPIMPIAQGRRLFEAASGPKRAVWIEGAGHQLPPLRVMEEIERFLADLPAA
ncbi:hypothetical protein BCF33_2660 [Hasllibacter halocynthiae]|uniref:Serine aminopeptidase S33 domain-containing protein n=1 Tax=Hasllibacter halocynthiae TaxID=595589 RepID=A0A2T0X4B1_9RHOB|nr:alpha/beta hydrolase [Hasllibacter halocynthiae]PRY93776.1 hypothetical protein BCF33_2660 [Hasllibacter halocynthiae]